MNDTPKLAPETEQEVIRLTTEGSPGALYGWGTPGKALALASLILEHKPKLCVDLGVFGGRTFIPMAMALKQLGTGMAYGIDSWSISAAVEGCDPHDSEDWNNMQWWSTCPLETIQAHCAAAIERLELFHHCAMIRGRSEHVHELFTGIGLLHIDGNHTIEVSCRDVRQWLPRVAPGGLIAFDDADWASTQRAQALMLERGCTLIREFNERATKGPCWRLFQKPA